MTRTERARYTLSGWHFWVIIAYLGLVGVVVGLYFINGKTTRAEAKAAAVVARDAAVRQSRVEQCLDSRKPGSNLYKINRFLHGVQEFHLIIAMNNKALIESTPKTDPQYEVRLANYRRILGTVDEVSGVKFPIPTVAACKSLGSP